MKKATHVNGYLANVRENILLPDHNQSKDSQLTPHKDLALNQDKETDKWNL